MFNLHEHAEFYGEDLGTYFKCFKHNANVASKRTIQVIWSCYETGTYEL